MADDKKKQDAITAAGEPLPIDPETGDIDTEQLTQEQREQLEEIGRATGQIFNKLISENSEIAKAAERIRETISNVVMSDKLRESLQGLNETLRPLREFYAEIDELDPFIKAELKKDEYNGLTLEQLLNEHTAGELIAMRRDPDSIVYQIFEAAAAAKAKAERVTIQQADKIEYPLDKINSNAWRILQDNPDGQLSIEFDLLPKQREKLQAKGLQATAVYSINFDDLGDDVKITKRLQQFDKRVYTAVSALFNAGNSIITATQIHYAMGNTGKPSPNQIKKINDALSKMTGANITLDNSKEVEALHLKEELRVEYTGSLLPIERLTAIVNEQVVESAIHVFREPPLMSFAKQRKQVTTINVALLQSPLSKTEANLAIDDYLIERISRAKNSKGTAHHCRILYKTLYDKTGQKTRNQKARASEKIAKYLNHYQQQGFITRYTKQEDGVTVYY